jgi:2-oxoglutarate dehydrogenase E1 component
VVVDIICFRKLGHNEQDTPSLTQPLMYKKIAQHPGTRKLYADKLAAQGLGDTLGDDMVKALPRRLRRRQEHGRPGAHQLQEQVRRRLEPLPQQEVDRCRRHGHPLAEWKRLAESITTMPSSSPCTRW